MLRSVLRSDSQTYNNIFDALSDAHAPQSDIDAFRSALEAQETGSIVFQGDVGSVIYTFSPIKSMNGWHILSIVPLDAIQDKASGILRDSQMAVGLFALMLVIISVFIFLVWHIQKEIKEQEQENAYRSQLFEFSFTFLAENTDDVYIILDHETEELEYASPNLDRVLGVAPGELIGYLRAGDMAVDAEGASAYYTKFRALHPGEMAEPRSSERVNPKTGEHKYFLENVYRVDIQGRKKRVSYFADRTKERKTQNNLADALHMAQAASDAKSKFLSSVSHDIRTPEEDNQAVHEIQGTGLGMPITKNLVKLIGGTIAVESKLGEGTTFTVEIKFQIQERDVDPAFWTDHKLARMIVADDDEEVCCHIVKTMSKVGVVTDYATDGHTAVQMMRERREAGEPYDMILLDWKMPTLDGIETARLIRKNYPDKIPILLLTAYDWSDIEQEAKEIGVDHFMPKPFFMSTFREAVKRVMGSRQGKPEKSKTDVVRDKHILVVDDIEVNRIIPLKILSSLGAVCDSANNGQEAVDKFTSSQPRDYDLILMDVQMPVMDGYTATQTIRGSGHPSARSVPIIAMTANAFVDDVRETIESGMNAHIAKPVQVDNLKTAIQQVLDKKAEHNNG